MQHTAAKTTVTLATATAAATMFLLAAAAGDLPASSTKAAQTATEHSRQLFEDIHAVSQRFADELGRMQESHNTVSPAELAKQADAEKTYPLATRVAPDRKFNAQTIYAQAKPGVVIVGGIFKFTLHNDKHQPLNVLAVTTEYGPGSSGGPILDEHGAVAAVACQALPLLQQERDKPVQMIWRFARPSASILDLLGPSATKHETKGKEK
jgi:hypothetical protein